MRLKKLILLAFTCFLLPMPGAAEESSFFEKLQTIKWTAYAPTNFNPKSKQYPDQDSIKADLAVLQQAGFEGVVTYGAEGSLVQIPRLAKELGFQGVIMGIWDPGDQNELDISIEQSRYVDGYCVGNEGYKERYDIDVLRAAIIYVRERSAKPVTTTEQINDYFFDQDLLGVGDWIFPNAHPFLCGMRNAKLAASWTQDRFNSLRSHVANDMVILFKECGYPTKGISGASEKNQALFFNLLEQKEINVVYFEAFDQPWKQHLPCEPYWGLFDKDRSPKPIVKHWMQR